MDMITIRKLSTLDEPAIDQTVNLFIDAYFDQLSQLSSRREALFLVFKSAIQTEQFYVALEEGIVLGMIGYSTSTKGAMLFDNRVMKQAFGWLKGWLAYMSLGEPPIAIKEGQAYIEDVATAEWARGRGIATSLIQHLMETLPYAEFTLEVVDTNGNARRLYEKLGFTVFHSKKQVLFRRQAGFNERFYMIKKRA